MRNNAKRGQQGHARRTRARIKTNEKENAINETVLPKSHLAILQEKIEAFGKIAESRPDAGKSDIADMKAIIPTNEYLKITQAILSGLNFEGDDKVKFNPVGGMPLAAMLKLQGLTCPPKELKHNKDPELFKAAEEMIDALQECVQQGLVTEGKPAASSKANNETKTKKGLLSTLANDPAEEIPKDANKRLGFNK